MEFSEQLVIQFNTVNGQIENSSIDSTIETTQKIARGNRGPFKRGIIRTKTIFSNFIKFIKKKHNSYTFYKIT